MTNDPQLILITGIMAAGKSTVAQRLAERLPKSVHLRGDLFRRLIVNGRAEMGPDLSVEETVDRILANLGAARHIPSVIPVGDEMLRARAL